MNPHEVLAFHLKTRPELPRPFNPDSEEAQAFLKVMQAWVTQKERLESLARVHGLHIVFERQQPTCLPRTDIYHYNDPDVQILPKKVQKPRWSGATPEYMRQKQAESRAKAKAVREKAILEGLHERKVS